MIAEGIAILLDGVRTPAVILIEDDHEQDYIQHLKQELDKIKRGNLGEQLVR